jgi:pimeloyl-ACP methyl ester carboxylesterase
MAVQRTFRVGSGEPLVLVHGFTCTPLVWHPLLDGLRDRFDVLAVTLAGHVGGATLTIGSGRAVDALADQVERDMDVAGLQTAHVVGNSLGGWVALELAHRGRVRSVVALAPAGGWERDSREERRLKALFTRTHVMSSRMLPYLPRLVTRPRLRRLLLAQALAHGDRLDPASAYWITRDLVECPALFELMDAILRDGPAMGFERIECPVLLAWGTKDRVLPLRRYSPRMRGLLPEAAWQVLRGLGHMPMADDPELVVSTIAGFIAQAERGAVEQAPA